MKLNIEKIRALCDKKGLKSNRALAELTNVSASTIKNIFNKGTCSFQIMKKVAKGLGVYPDDILPDKDKEWGDG